MFLPQAQGLGGVALKYTGMWDVLSKTVRHEGFFGLYKASFECKCLQLPPLQHCVPLACRRRLMFESPPLSQICAGFRHHAKPRMCQAFTRNHIGGAAQPVQAGARRRHQLVHF